MANHYQIAPATRIGHVHLKVTNLERSMAFYQDVMGFTLTQRYGQQAAFLAAGGYHHHIGLNTWHSQGTGPAPERAAGLYHAAILVPTRLDLSRFLRHLVESGHPLDGAADHGVSHALYLRDPDENGLEVYWDLPTSEWPYTAQGELDMGSKHLDLKALLDLSR